MISYGMGGQTVCITGGASGIGLATARVLAADGANVALLDIRPEELDAARKTLPEGRVLTIAADVRDAARLEAAADRIEAAFGPVSGLVTAAGISGAGRSEDLEEAEFTRVMAVNVTGSFLVCRTFGKRMIRHRKGSIVTVGSVAGLGAHPGRSHYVASKFAVSGLTRNLAAEWGRHNVRVNCIAPSMIDTPLLRAGVPQSFIDGVTLDRTPMGRMGTPDEIASVAAMLLSEAASYVTGVVLPVDGGLLAGPVIAGQGANLFSTRLLEAGVYTE